ncbi:MAG: DNA recombination protein RmuC [Candidatus Aminicenantes bacterium]|nr:DNA recombination protein RmuC [Candidatus Aminicenantes bacterium]
MDFSLLIAAGTVGAVLVLASVFIIRSSLRETSQKIEEIKKAQEENKSMSLMQQQISELTNNINQQLHNISGQFQKTTGHIGTTLGDVKENIGRMETVTKQVLEKARNISNLENLLRAPKFRGGLGELFLGDLLAQILPPANFKLQHKFKTGDMVDAVIKIGNNRVPIDSKFPLENFKKYLKEENDKEKTRLRKKFVNDVKKHIDVISEKYILPDEGTFDFALMYIPAENIYYETILREENITQNKSIFSYATQKRVIPVSPNSFFAYLQVIVLGLKGLQIEKSAQYIFQSLSRLQNELSGFKDCFNLVGTHLNNASTKYDEAEKKLSKFTDKIKSLDSYEADLLEEKKETE